MGKVTEGVASSEGKKGGPHRAPTEENRPKGGQVEEHDASETLGASWINCRQDWIYTSVTTRRSCSVFDNLAVESGNGALFPNQVSKRVADMGQLAILFLLQFKTRRALFPGYLEQIAPQSFAPGIDQRPHSTGCVVKQCDLRGPSLLGFSAGHG